MVAGLDAVAALRRQVFAGPRFSVQLSVGDELQLDPHERAGEVRVLLSHADVIASVGGVEGANQETSIGVHDTIVQLDLGSKKKRKNILNLLKYQTGNTLN